MNASWNQLDGVEQILPYDGWELELLRRRLLDCLYQNGYELVVPPLADFVESLLGGTNEDLDLLTVKTPDYVSGKLFGIRADMTPQVARMAALHLPVQDTVVRLCYFGPTLLARAPNIGGSRELLQFGAELFGSSSRESDCEIVRLMVECLNIAGIESLSVSLGHVGIIEEISRALQLEGQIESEILSALQKKSKPRLRELATQYGLQQNGVEIFCDLTELNGDIGVIDSANERLSGISMQLDLLLGEFEQVVRQLSREMSHVEFHVDYAQTGGYKYHTGVIFAAYGLGYGHALAKGGRYDHVLAAYGTPCPATGFSGDLRLLRRAIRGECRKGILIAAGAEVSADKIAEAVSRGARIIRQLPDQSCDRLAMICDREFVKQDGDWQIVPFGVKEEAE